MRYGHVVDDGAFGRGVAFTLLHPTTLAGSDRLSHLDDVRQ